VTDYLIVPTVSSLAEIGRRQIASGFARTTADEVRVHRQPENSQANRCDDPAQRAGAGGSGDQRGAGINRHGVADERTAQERSSAPSWPRVMHLRPQGGGRSVDRGTRRPGIELRNHHFGVPTLFDMGSRRGSGLLLAFNGNRALA